ncbi:MAG: S26 family signal peptidase [Actinomycetota bacterium]
MIPLRRLTLLALGSLAFVAFLRRWRPFPAVVAGESMVPTLAPGSFVVATERGPVRPGAVVVVARGELEAVKRVASVEDGLVTVLGDNPEHSTDSREFGPVPAEAVRGVVRAVYWPPRRAGLVS